MSLHDITKHGAVPGERPCTAAIQAAVDAAHAAGGGSVHVPAGTWTAGTIVLRSGVVLDLHPRAVLQASTNLADYAPQAWEVSPDQQHHLLFADGAEDLTITGGGTIDGRGLAFWNEPAAGGRWYRERDPRVHPLIELRRCRRLRLRDIRIRNSPGWTVHPFCCDDVEFRGVTVENHPYGPNTDGFDIDGCRDMLITGCRLHCGDDAIIIKATAKARSTERLVISDCVCRSTCIGIGIGQECESGIRHVTISNCVISASHRMIGIGTWNGGDIEDVVISGITGDTLGTYSLARCIQLEAKQSFRLPATRPLGVIRRVSISHVCARTQGRLVLATAQDGTWIDGLSLHDLRADYVHLEDCSVSGRDGAKGSDQYANRNTEARCENAAVVLENVRGLELAGVRVSWPETDAASQVIDGPQRGPGSPEPGWAVLWARNCPDARIELPMARASRAGLPAVRLDRCDGTITVPA
jgi:polygalacturonase